MNRREFLRNAVQGLAGLAGLAVASNSTATAEQVEAAVPPDEGRLPQDDGENGGYLVPPEFKDRLQQLDYMEGRPIKIPGFVRAGDFGGAEGRYVAEADSKAQGLPEELDQFFKAAGLRAAEEEDQKILGH